MRPTSKLLSAALVVAHATDDASAQEPTPTPEPKAQAEPTDDFEAQDKEPGSGCSVSSLGYIWSSTTRNGVWTSSCTSVNRSGRYARFYSFSVSGTKNLQIDLTSTVDTYMYLLSGSGLNGSVLTKDDGGAGRNSRIVRQISSGSYTIEATTFSSAKTGGSRSPRLFRTRPRLPGSARLHPHAPA